MSQEFLNFLLKNKNTRKIFGNRELKIIEKQLNGINLTQSEKNRLSRDIRKKLELIKEISRFREEFGLKKSGIIKSKINDIRDVIMRDSHFPIIKKIVLYGSTAENERTFRSDIDIAVEFDKIDDKEAAKFRIKIMSYFNEKVDIQVYNALPEKIKKEIDNHGKTIYERKNK